MIYATDNSDGVDIHRSASIIAFDTQAAALAFLLAPYSGPAWDTSKARLETGRFGDCWLKSWSGPFEPDQYAPFDAADMYFADPGDHPAGRQWWATPRVDVYVLTGILEVEQDD